MKQLGFSVVCLCVWEREREVLQNKASIQKMIKCDFCGGASSSGEEFA